MAKKKTEVTWQDYLDAAVKEGPADSFRQRQLHVDRGLGIVLGSMVDNALEDMLAHFLVEPIEDLMDRNRPLDAFSSRIDVARAVGIYGKSTQRDLHTIRDIRNAWAHKFGYWVNGKIVYLSYKDSPICDLCANLKCVSRHFRWLDDDSIRDPSDPSDRYFVATTCLALEFREICKRRKRIAKNPFLP